MTTKRRLAGLATLALLAACNLMSPTPSVEPGASVQQDASECSAVDIRAPSGATVDLTGVWRANDLGLYHIHQEGSCLYWMGMSHDPGTEPGEFWTNVFIGTVRSDFTIVGRYGDVPFHPGAADGYGSMRLRIDFDQATDVERPVLRVVDPDPGFGASVWVLEESVSAPIELLGTFGGTVGNTVGDDTVCPWIESDGQRFELIGSGEWGIRPVPLSVQTADGRIFARVGDPIRVRGRVSVALAEFGSGCTEQAIVVEELDPTP